MARSRATEAAISMNIADAMNRHVEHGGLDHKRGNALVEAAYELAEIIAHDDESRRP